MKVPAEIIESILQFLPLRNILCCSRVSQEWDSVINDDFMWRCIEMKFGKRSHESDDVISRAVCWLTEIQRGDITELSNGNVIFDVDTHGKDIHDNYGSWITTITNCEIIDGHIYSYNYKTKTITSYGNDGNPVIKDVKIEKYEVGVTFNGKYKIYSIHDDSAIIIRGGSVYLILTKISEEYYITTETTNHYLYDKNFKPVNCPSGNIRMIFHGGFIVHRDLNKSEMYDNNLKLYSIIPLTEIIYAKGYMMSLDDVKMSLYSIMKLETGSLDINKIFTIDRKLKCCEDDYTSMVVYTRKNITYIVLATGSGYFVKFTLDGKFVKYIKTGIEIKKFHIMKTGRVLCNDSDNYCFIVDLI